MITAVVLLAMAVLVSIAFFKESPLLRIVTVAVMVIGLMWREFSFGAYLRGLIGRSDLEGEMLEHYRDGALAMFEYCEGTSIYVIALGMLLIVVCIRGFRRPKQK
ncbi:MAG: hypothetical protein AB1744_05815 [Candidatus Zixiibacteriota bacterium]